MEYTEIVLRGFFNLNSRKFLARYFVRECKIAEQQFYGRDEFFTGCLDVVKSLQFPFEFLFLQRKEELKKLWKQAKLENNTESTKYCKKELRNLKKENFTVPLASFKVGTLTGGLNYWQTEYIEKAINEAISITSPKDKYEAKHEHKNITESETTVNKISGKLESLRKAFEETGHIDKIIKALAEYAEGKTPDCVENQKFDCMNIKFSSRAFYTPFKGLNKTIDLPNKKIAEVLHYFIYANDNSQNSIQISAIEQNIKRKYPKAI